MKVVSAAKLRKAQQRIVQMRPYAEQIKAMLANLSDSMEGDAARFFKVKPINKVLLLVVTSDRGLAGSFNSVVLKEAMRLIREDYAGKQVDVIAVGKKARDFFKKTNHKMVEENVTIFSNLIYDDAEKIAANAINLYLNGDYEAIDLIYNKFKNAAVYIPTAERFLPVIAATGTTEKTMATNYIFEPTQEEIVARLIPQSLKVNFFKSLLESNAAEHGARMTAMDKATENAEELLKALRLSYNKERQATITKEILEIVGGAQALNG